MGASASYPSVQVTRSAPSNIALIKYWGKRDSSANLPINSSMSMTLAQEDLCATTTVTASASFTADRLWLNGSEEDITANARVLSVLKELRRRARDAHGVPADALRHWRVHIVSRNSFPTAAGLASSAAGYAALVVAVAAALGVEESFPGELSTIARRGSGSASRSLWGGFVEWRMGSRVDGTDSLGVPLAPREHWPDVRILIAVVSAARKSTGSTDGMVRSVKTSALLRYRAAALVNPRLDIAKAAVLARNFAALADVAMADSNQFHATCLDTFPPIFYLNDVSRRIIGLVHALNDAMGATVAGYTFDAGPNAVLFTSGAKTAALLLALLRAHFPPAPDAAAGWVTGSTLSEIEAEAVQVPASLACVPADATVGALAHVYATCIGDGPRDTVASLADRESGLPLDTTVNTDMDKGL